MNRNIAILGTIALLVLPCALSAQRVARTGDPKDYVLIAEVDGIADTTAVAEIRRFPNGNPRNVVLIPRRRMTASSIASALALLTTMRNAQGKDHKEMITAFQHKLVMERDMPLAMERAATDYREKLRLSPMVSVRGLNAPAHTVIVYLSAPKKK